MLHVDHSRHAQSPGSSLPGTRVAAHGKRAAPLLARFLLTAQGAGASGLFSQPRVRHGAFIIEAVFSVCVPFPFGVWGRMWISLVSVPDHCLFIYSFWMGNANDRNHDGYITNTDSVGRQW